MSNVCVLATRFSCSCSQCCPSDDFFQQDEIINSDFTTSETSSNSSSSDGESLCENMIREETEQQQQQQPKLHWSQLPLQVILAPAPLTSTTATSQRNKKLFFPEVAEKKTGEEEQQYLEHDSCQPELEFLFDREIQREEKEIIRAKTANHLEGKFRPRRQNGNTRGRVKGYGNSMKAIFGSPWLRRRWARFSVGHRNSRKIVEEKSWCRNNTQLYRYRKTSFQMQLKMGLIRKDGSLTRGGGGVRPPRPNREERVRRV